MATPGVFTSGWQAQMGTADPANFFTSENAGYNIYRDASGEARLSKPYTVTVDSAIEHGSVRLSPARGNGMYGTGETVTLLATPSDLYALNKFTVKQGQTDVQVTGNTFTMPAGDVSVTAAFSQWKWLQEEMEKGGKITLERDYLCDDQDLGPLTVPAEKTLTLDLNGHILDRGLSNGQAAVNGSVIEVYGTLTVTDSNSTAAHDPAVTYTDPTDSTKTVTVTGGVITGGNSANYGGGVYVESGSFTLESGSISGNSAVLDGGGVCIYSGGTFYMQGGSISGNSADTYGGVYVESDSSFDMTGGSISGNSANTYGGVFIRGGNFTLSGSPEITGNTEGTGESKSNVYLEEDAIITVDGALTNTTSIGVTMETPGVFTSGWADKMGTADPADYFTSENADCNVYRDASDEARLSVPYKVTTEADPAAGGSVTVTPARGNGMYGEGETVTLLATPTDFYAFDSFTVTGADNNPVTVTGNTFTMPAENVTVKADFARVPVTYIDDKGVQQSCTDYTVLYGGGAKELAGGWYVVPKLANNATVDYTGTLTLAGHVHLILEDGATMNVGTESSPIFDTGLSGSGTEKGDGKNLAVYAQSLDDTSAGALNVYSSNSNSGGIFLPYGSLTINGGKVMVKTADSGSSGIYSGFFTMNGGKLDINGKNTIAISGSYGITINAGTVSATCKEKGLLTYFSDGEGKIIINGGIVSVSVNNPSYENPAICTMSDSDIIINGGIVSANSFIKSCNGANTIILGLSEASDSIHATGYSGNVKVDDGKCLTDGTNAYYGTLTGKKVEGQTLVPAIANKTLCPAYGVMTGSLTGGRMSASPEAFAIKDYADANKTVTLTVTPDENYTTGTVSYNDGSDHTLTPVNGKYTFTMPDKNVTASAVFLKTLAHSDITVEAISEQTYTGSAIRPSVTVKDGDTALTAGKDYTLSYSSNTNAGTASVTLTGMGGYAGTKTVSFTIAKKPVTITANNQSVEYNGSIATGTDQVSITDLNTGHSLSSISLALAEGIATNAVGEYANAIVPSGAVITDSSDNTVDVTENYNITYAGGKLTVTKIQAKVTTHPTAIANLRYTGESQTLIKAGAADTAMEYALGESETTAPTSGYSASVPDGTNAGSYFVWYRAAEDENHTPGGELVISATIQTAPLTVTAKNHSITYGDAPANDGVQYSGFVHGETESVLSGKLAYDYSYTQYGNAGSDWTITPKGLTGSNYTISFVPGKLTVLQKEVGLSWNTAPLTYSGSAQAPTAEATGLVNGDTVSVTVSGAQTNAGTGYTATANALTGDKAGNYKLPEAKTQER